MVFQSTLPVWGATEYKQAAEDGIVISIHAPRVGSDGTPCASFALAVISIHAPRVGSDYRKALESANSENISIHAPRVGSDPRTGIRLAFHRYFNPRSPCGERLVKMYSTAYHSHFNPRSPCGERRPGIMLYPEEHKISIHAPRVGSDSKDA